MLAPIAMPLGITFPVTSTITVTLKQAQQLASGANDALGRISQLQVEAAKQHRLGVQSLYFPNISTQFDALHFNKTLGEVLTVRRPFVGETVSVPVNLFAQDQFAVNVVVAQPLTQLFAVRQLVKIAGADEKIARAKAGLPDETARRVEKNYYDLLIAERELARAGADAKIVRARLVTVSHSAVTRDSADQQTNTIGAERSLVLTASKVRELTASLNELLGLPHETRLELVPPEPLVESLTLKEAVAQAATASIEVVEAEQTAVKAHAGTKLARMAYGPGIAVVGGYTHQTILANTVLAENFAYVGVVGTYTLFDSLKRERSVKEATAQAEAADLAAQLTREKVAASVKSAYFELERSREVYRLARRMVSAPRMVDARYMSEDHEVESARARMEADMFRAELEYREAYARLKSLMGN